MFRTEHKLCILVVVLVTAFGTNTSATPVFPNKAVNGPLSIPGLEYLGSTLTKELEISTVRKSSFHYALGFGCSYVYGSENNLTLAAIETINEVDILDQYFAKTQSQDQPVEPVWTSGIDRLGNIKKQWASTGKAIESYPTSFQGDWSPGQGNSPTVADYNCVVVWRYCDRQGHGATIPGCSRTPYGTWFSPRPCWEERRYICERSLLN